MAGLASIPDLTFGSVTLRPSIRQFECRTRRLTLEPRVMQVLVALVEADGAVLSRDDLIQRCWEGRAVSEDAINRCIGQLRRLAKSCGEPCFTIECIPRVGYRLLVAPLQRQPPRPPVPGLLYGMLLAQQSAVLLAYGGHSSDGFPITWALQYSGPLLAMIGLALSLGSWFRIRTEFALTQIRKREWQKNYLPGCKWAHASSSSGLSQSSAKAGSAR